MTPPTSLLVLGLLWCSFGSSAVAQNHQSPGDLRKIISKTSPTYPETARRMHLSGSVKILVTVGPDGSVKSIQAMGGNPLLIQAAEDALYKWKFATASAESKELIELHFDPH